MNRKYIDFVPTAKGENAHRQSTNLRKTVAVEHKSEKVIRKMPETTPSASGFSIKNEPKLGIIEDYNPKFVNNEVPKRPLHSQSIATITTSSTKIAGTTVAKATTIKAKKVRAEFSDVNRGLVVEKPVKKPVEKLSKNGENVNFVPPRSPFINQEKVLKRPLSKNVYQKNVEVPKEEPKGPVTIITKPEKDSKMGLLVTII